MASLPIANFQFANGSPVANGYITVRLNIDGSINDTSINSKFTKIALDSDGAPVDDPQFNVNADISPSGTYYIVNVYTAAGQLVAGPLSMTVS